MSHADEERGNISASEDEDDIDPSKHAKFIDAIYSLDVKKKIKLSERTLPVAQALDYNFLPTENKKVALHELVGTIHDNPSHGNLKRKLRNAQKRNKLVSVPLSKHEKQKFERTVAYESTSRSIAKWDPVVKANRKAGQMIFPLQRSGISVNTTDEFVKQFQPRTPLEMEVATALAGSPAVTRKTKALTLAEERALKAMRWKEAKGRRAELLKYRAILSYKEAKARWQGRIKSKKYHRVLKKQKVKQEKTLEELHKKDPEGYQEKMDNLEKQRIQERMSLKHRGGSKFAHKRTMYSKYDGQTREQVQSMLQKNRDLTQKLTVVIDSEGEEEIMSLDYKDDMLAEFNEENPWMTKNSGKGRILVRPEMVMNRKSEMEEKEDRNDRKSYLRKDIETKLMSDSKSVRLNSPQENLSIQNRQLEWKESEELHEEKIEGIFFKLRDDCETSWKKADTDFVIPDRKETIERDKSAKKGKRNKDLRKKQKKGLAKGRKLEGDVYEHLDEEEENDKQEEELISESLTRVRTLEDVNCETFLMKNENAVDTRMTSKRVKRLKKGKGSANQDADVLKESKSEICIDPKKLMKADYKVKSSAQNVVEEGDLDNDSDDQKITISQAFEDDNVIDEFSKEKQEVIERYKPEDKDLTLPGWGCWGGTGITPLKSKRKRFMMKVPLDCPRKDLSLGNVIISEPKDKTISKYQVNDLPFPFGHVSQFENSIRAPIGKIWNPETAFRELVKPKVVTKLGEVITPLDKKDVFQNQKSKTELHSKKTELQYQVNERYIEKKNTEEKWTVIIECLAHVNPWRK